MNNDIPQPKFSIGEQVILQSKAYPECNGEATVLDILPTVGAVDRKGVLTVQGGYSYKLTIETPEQYRYWHELALRKKHDGSEFTFDQLMSTLKQPCNV